MTEWNVFIHTVGLQLLCLTFSTEETARAFARDYLRATPGSRLAKDTFDAL